jgi:hypothetical protein
VKEIFEVVPDYKYLGVVVFWWQAGSHWVINSKSEIDKEILFEHLNVLK